MLNNKVKEETIKAAMFTIIASIPSDGMNTIIASYRRLPSLICILFQGGIR